MLKRLTSFGAALSIVALTTAVGGCKKTDTLAGEFKIGLICMLSGDYAQDGRNMVDAASLAVGEANNRGGVRLREVTTNISLVVEDDRSNPEGAMNAARKLIYQDEVAVLVGPQFSRNAIPVARLAEDEHVVMICPMSTHPDTTAGKSYVFRIPYLDTFQGRVLARLAREKLHCASAAVLFDVAGIYSSTLAQVFKKTFEEGGGEVVALETYTSDDTQDFSEQISRIAEYAPDVLFLPNYANDALLQAQQAREAGIEATLLGGDGWDMERFSSEQAFQGAFATGHWHPEIASAGAVSFFESFRQTFCRVPGDVAATTYDAINLVLLAVKRGTSTDPEVIREQLYNIESFAGVTGTIRYEEVGDPVKGAVVINIEDGEASFYAFVEP